MMNSRQIRELLGPRGAGIHPNLGRVIISMSEDLHTMQQQVKLLAGMFDQMCNLVNAQVGALSAVKQEQAKALKRMGIEVSSDPSLTGEASEDAR